MIDCNVLCTVCYVCPILRRQFNVGMFTISFLHFSLKYSSGFPLKPPQKHCFYSTQTLLNVLSEGNMKTMENSKTKLKSSAIVVFGTASCWSSLWFCPYAPALILTLINNLAVFKSSHSVHKSMALHAIIWPCMFTAKRIPEFDYKLYKLYT